LSKVKHASYINELSELRKPRCCDMGHRLGVLTADRIFLKNFPQRHPVTAFNPALLIRKDIIHVYTRMILGYYKYVSAVARIDLSLEDLEEGYIMYSQYPAELVVWPSTKYDIWGVEDPRVQYLDDLLLMIYTGRTYFYFSNINTERTVPVIAVTSDPYSEWTKIAYLTLPNELRGRTITNKDVVLLDGGNDNLFVLHRPHLENEPPCLWIGKISKEAILEAETNEVKDLRINDNMRVMVPASFEERIGWGTPPIRIGKDEWLAIIHAMGLDEVYRLTAITIRYDGEYPMISGVTPFYIMEPREVYERFGDRPSVVFACGAQLIKDKLIVSYGAADSFVAFAEFDLNALLSEVKYL